MTATRSTGLIIVIMAIFVLVFAAAVMIGVTSNPNSPAARLARPTTTVGKPCSDERMNYLARVDPERMKAEFKVCVDDLARKRSH